MSAVSAAPPVLTPQPSRAAEASRSWDAPRARGSLAPAPYPPRLSASVLSVRSVSLCSAGLLQATWCLRLGRRVLGLHPDRRKPGAGGRIGWDGPGLEEIKETQKLPGPVPLVIPQSLGSGACRKQSRNNFQRPGEEPFSTSLQS